jgi:hypothetical protein
VPCSADGCDQEPSPEHELDDRGRDEEPAIDVHHWPGSAARPEHDGHHHHADDERDEGTREQLAPFHGAIGLVSSLRGIRSGHRAGIASDLVSGGLDACHDSGTVDQRRVEAHGGPLGGEIDVRLRHAISAVEVSLDAIDAAGARHADDGQSQFG